MTAKKRTPVLERVVITTTRSCEATLYVMAMDLGVATYLRAALPGGEADSDESALVQVEVMARPEVAAEFLAFAQSRGPAAREGPSLAAIPSSGS